MPESACHVVLLTPTGRGAVATVLVAGSRALESVERLFAPAAGKPLHRFPLQRIVFGRWLGPADAGEELVVCRRSDQQIEIHCHGGSAAAEAIIDTLVSAGCQRIAWQDRLADELPDPLARQALTALTAARTERTAAILLDQYRGALGQAVDKILSHLEAGQVEQAAESLADLQRFAPVGLHLTQPWRVVLAGRVNVGKSSLINAVLGYGRAIVFDQPGTTRDVITAHTALEGWPVELADTAGLRMGADPVELAGIEKSRQRIAAADLVVLVHDASQTWSPENQTLQERFPQALIVHNKSDLLDELPIPPGRAPDRPQGIWLSALSGQGVDDFTQAIVARLIPHVPPSGAAIPFTAGQVHAIAEASTALRHGDLTAAIGLVRSLRELR